MFSTTLLVLYTVYIYILEEEYEEVEQYIPFQTKLAVIEVLAFPLQNSS